MKPQPGSRDPLKVAVLSSASGGGAGIAARRVCDALNIAEGVSADFLDMVALGGRMPDDAAPPGNMSNRRMTDTHFTVEFSGYVRGWIVDLLSRYDLLNIHWASFLLGLAEIDELSRRGVPILFTCHDYFYFTGGCHYPATCKNLSKGCVGCPQVNQNYCSSLVISQNLKIKKAILARPNVHLSAPSAFLVNEAVQAGLISADKAHVLRNPYFPVHGITGVKREGPPKIVLIADSMTERRKAMPLAIKSLGLAWQVLRKESQGVTPFIVQIIGNADEVFKGLVQEAGFSYVLHGRIAGHEEIAALLSQCELILSCSFEDNWPNVLVEAGSYGVVPIVGPGHGCEEFVSEFSAGLAAQDYSAESFSAALIKGLRQRSPADTNHLVETVRQAHSPEKIQRDYIDVLKKILSLKEARDSDHCSVDYALNVYANLSAYEE